MQLTTTTIKHKRYSTAGWSVLNDDGSTKNTLSQGEIGLLLGHKYSQILQNGEEIFVVEPVEAIGTGKDLNAILEVRIGTENNQKFFDALLIGKNGDIDYSIRQVSTLPSWGSPNCLYILTTSNEAYRWDEISMKMIPLSGTGGSVDLSNYYTKEEVEKLICFDAIDGGNSICNPSLHK